MAPVRYEERMNGLASLDLFDFGILLQALSNSLKVGLLAVRSESREKYLELDRSRVTCVWTRRAKAPLEKVLWNHRAIEKPALRVAADAVAADPAAGPLGRYLVDQGLVTPAQLRRAHAYQMLEEVAEVFYWRNVGFEFHADAEKALSGKGFVAVGEPIEVDQLLLRCTKTIDDVAKFNEVTPSLRDVYELELGGIGDIEAAIPDPVEREFLLLIDGVRDMREVLRDMRMNRFDGLGLFYRFRSCGWLRPKSGAELLALAEERRAEFPLEKRARLLERVGDLGADGYDLLPALAETYGGMGASEKAAQLFTRQAAKCIEAGDAEGAVLAAARARELRPNDLEVNELQIAALRAAGRTVDAAASLRNLAELRSRRGDLRGAVADLRHAARLAPNEPAAWRKLAEAHGRCRAPRRAAACWRRAGDTLRASGDVEGAVDAYRYAQKLCKTAFTVRYRLADLFHAEGRGDVAVQGLAELVELAVNAPNVPRTMRVSHLKRIERRLREMGGLASSAAAQVGRAWIELGNPERAVALFRESAEILSRAGRHQGAVEVLSEMMEHAPTDHDARRLLARELLCSGDVTRAFAHLRRLAAHFLGAGRYEEALAVFEEMLKADPACPDAHRGLARALLYLGDADRAAEHYHRVGLIYRGYGRPEEAAPYLREAVERRPTDARLLEEYCELLAGMPSRDDLLHALSALVELHMSQGRPASAAIALTRILEIDEHYPGARGILQEAARRLLSLGETTDELSADDARRAMEAARASQ